MKNFSTLFLVLLFSTLHVYGQKDCQLRRDENGIKIYTCKEDGRSLKTVKVHLKLPGTLREYKKNLFAVEDYKTWHYRVIEPVLLEKIDSNSFLYYTKVDAPWPVSDRDLVLKVTVKHLPMLEQMEVIMQNQSDVVQVNKDLVRIPYSYSRMTLSQSSPNELTVDYNIKLDPGGSLPSWAINLFCTQGPFETFSNLKKILGQKDHNSLLLTQKSEL